MSYFLALVQVQNSCTISCKYPKVFQNSHRFGLVKCSGHCGLYNLAKCRKFHLFFLVKFTKFGLWVGNSQLDDEEIFDGNSIYKFKLTANLLI